MTDNNSETRTKIFLGVMWKGLERIMAQLVSTVVSVVLARLLMPDDYSVVSIVAIFFSFCNLFISGGLNTSLIQKKDADNLDYSTVLVCNLFFAVFFYVVLFFCAPLISNIYDKPILIPVIRVMALSFFINGYKAVLCAKVSSQMQFKKFFFSTIIGTIISAVVGILMALNGCGAWALVAQQMINSLIDAIFLTISSSFTISLKFSKLRFVKLFSYGGRIFFASIITTIYDECRPLIVGIKFSSSDLAYYNKGSSFPGLINSIGNNTLSSVLFPAMSKFQDDKPTLLSMTRRFIKLSSFVVFPMMLGFLAISRNFVLVVLTEKWLPIVPYIMVFCVSYMFDLIQVGNLQPIRALGRSDLILRMEIIKKLLYAVVIIVTVIFSQSPILLAITSIVNSIIATIVNSTPNKKLINYGIKEMLSDILPNVLPASIMAIAVYAMQSLSINVILLFLLQIVVGIVLYLLLCLITKNENLAYAVFAIKGLLKK